MDTRNRGNERWAAATAVLWMGCLMGTVALLSTMGSSEEAPTEVRPAAQPAAESVEPPPVADERAPVVLVADLGPGSGRDPFQPPGILIHVPPIEPPGLPDLDECQMAGGVLTDVELGSLKLQAVARMKAADAKVLVTDPTGFGVILTEGDRVGRECAKVVEIDDDQVCLELDDGFSRAIVKLRLHPESPRPRFRT